MLLNSRMHLGNFEEAAKPMAEASAKKTKQAAKPAPKAELQAQLEVLLV